MLRLEVGEGGHRIAGTGYRSVFRDARETERSKIGVFAIVERREGDEGWLGSTLSEGSLLMVLEVAFAVVEILLFFALLLLELLFVELLLLLLSLLWVATQIQRRTRR